MASGIGLFTGQNGAVREVVARFKRGELSNTTEPNVPSHFGTADMTQPYAAAVGGRGGGMGRGMGMGRRMTGGRGFAAPQGLPPAQGTAGPSKTEELKMLRDEARSLAEQMTNIVDRLEKLEKDLPSGS